MTPKGTAIVTGAAQGIGREIALRLADDGYDITVIDIPANQQKVEGVAKLVVDKGRKALAVTGDVSKEEDIEELVQKTVKELGGLDVMVANAGIGEFCHLTEIDVGKWDNIFNVNVRGTMICYKYAAIQMIKQGRGGRIIGAASTASKRGMVYGSAYSASKFAIRGLTQSAAAELGKYGITVNAYAPGPIDTTFFEKFDDYCASCTGKEKGSYREEAIGRTPLGRLGTPKDVAGLVSFLVSEKASFVNGQSIIVDGGTVFD